MFLHKNHLSIYLLFSITLILFIFKLLFNYYLALPLHFDEAQYWDWSRNLDWGYFSKPPFLAFLIKTITITCGDTENCIRSLSPILHSFTGVIIYYTVYTITRNQYISIFGSLLYLIMPGVIFSSLFISTDAPLLLFSSLSALFIVKIFNNKNNKSIYFLFLSISLAFGILSKYAALYILISIFTSIIFIRESRKFFINKKFLLCILGIIIIIAPNISWNLQNNFVTFSHTASNANLQGLQLNIHSAIFFFSSQIFIFGIIPFVLTFKNIINFKNINVIQKVVFLNFLIPIILVLFLATFSRANSNWAVVGYPFGCIFLASIIDKKKQFLIKACLTNQFIFSFVLLIFIFTLPNFNIDPFYKIRHIKSLAIQIENELKNTENVAFMADDREDFAHLNYYIKEMDVIKVKWNGDKKIDDHYELTTSVEDLINKNVLFLTRTKPTKAMIDRCEKHEKISSYKFTYGNKERVFNLFLLKSWN